MSSPNFQADLFFESNYRFLRGLPGSMRWMQRLFGQLANGRWPRLLDLPTGSGKTDLVVIWLSALAWYGLEPETRNPIPRRLVWVINRRVLVQQVFDLAWELQVRLSGAPPETGEPGELRRGLERLGGNGDQVFRVVQLRGQLIDDREWSVAPCVPTLIIGTVDQIGSRFLFQGYGLGKWSRPLQAAMLGLDAWMCVDEAHLVPSFVLTMRQAYRLVANGSRTPEPLSGMFARLPSWFTELSATPALPSPKSERIFQLEACDENDPFLADRLLAAQTRRVKVAWLNESEKLEDTLQSAAAGLDGKARRVAVFVRAATQANKIAKGLNNQFKNRVISITGRLRGYERDRLKTNPVFKRFRPQDAAFEEHASETVYLVGTAAAEVGLDADAEAVVCDFASLPTLVQRLGRFDRRGTLSKLASEGRGEPPTMTIVAPRSIPKREVQQRVVKLARALRAEEEEFSPSLLVGEHWKSATGRSEDKNLEEREADAEALKTKAAENKDAKGLDPKGLVSEATWIVVLGRKRKELTARSPSDWLKCPIACVTAGPVVVPPLAASLLTHWAATSVRRNQFMPVHPFLYGALPDEETVPLVGIAFRLEMDALLPWARIEDGEEEDANTEIQIKEVLKRFPVRRSELHFVPLAKANAWLSLHEAAGIPVAQFDGDDWSLTLDGSGIRNLRPEAVLVLPTLTPPEELDDLLEDSSKIASSDVLEGVATDQSVYKRRIVQSQRGDHRLIKTADGAYRFERAEPAEDASTSVTDGMDDLSEWECRARCSVAIGTSVFRFEYWRPSRSGSVAQLLDDHLARARQDAKNIGGTLAPTNDFLQSVLQEAAKWHDFGKTDPKWQHAMGNRDTTAPVAKPLVEHPERLKGYRHEWQSLLEMKAELPPSALSWSEEDRQLWLDLVRHLVASHHGNFRPWLSENTLERHSVGKRRQSVLRLESAERFARLQQLLGPWRLAYLEALLKAADVTASQVTEFESRDEQ